MNKINYSRETEKIISSLQQQGEVPTLLLQACCAPCSSYCLEYLREYFRITVLYYNPNISLLSEYEKRKAEEIRLIEEYNRQVAAQDFEGMHSTSLANRIDILDCPYDNEKYEAAVRGLEDCPEGGDRCSVCFKLRLGQTAMTAAERGFDFFTTTLTISPLKNADKLNRIGEEAAQQYHVRFLPSDFKKKDGYKRSIELSAKFGLYRQNFCGCRYSQKSEAERRA